MTEFSGFDDLAEEFADWGEDFDEARARLHEDVEKGTRNAAVGLQNKMIEEAPVGESGDLIESIGHDNVSSEYKDDVTFSVGPDDDKAPYAPYVEFGTGKHGPRGSSYTILPRSLSEVEFEAAKQRAQEAYENGEDPTQPMRDLAREHGALDVNGTPKLVVQHPGSKGQFFFNGAVNWAEEKRLLTDRLDKATDDTFEALRK